MPWRGCLCLRHFTPTGVATLDPWQGEGGAAIEREHPGAALPLQQRERAK